MKKSLPILFSVILVVIVFSILTLVRRSSDSEKNQNQTQTDESITELQDESHSSDGEDNEAVEPLPGGANANSSQQLQAGNAVGGTAVSAGVAGSQSAVGAAAVGGSALSQNAGQAVGGANGLKQGASAGAEVAALIPGKAGIAAPGASLDAATNPSGVPVTTIPNPTKAPSCVRVSFSHKEKDLKVKRHELTLSEKLEKKPQLCVTINGEGVHHSLDKDSKIILDHRIREKGTEIIATYCRSGACKLSCPKPKKDFFDAISSESSDEVIRGFSGDQSAEEKQLQRELVTLQKLLKEPNAKKRVAQWTESKRVDGPCTQVVQYSKVD